MGTSLEMQKTDSNLMFSLHSTECWCNLLYLCGSWRSTHQQVPLSGCADWREHPGNGSRMSYPRCTGMQTGECLITYYIDWLIDWLIDQWKHSFNTGKIYPYLTWMRKMIEQFFDWLIDWLIDWLTDFDAVIAVEVLGTNSVEHATPKFKFDVFSCSCILNITSFLLFSNFITDLH